MWHESNAVWFIVDNDHFYTHIFGVCDVGGGGGDGGVGKTIRSWSFTVQQQEKPWQKLQYSILFFFGACPHQQQLHLSSLHSESFFFLLQIKISFDFQDYEHLPIIFNKVYYIKAKQIISNNKLYDSVINGSWA